MADSVVLDSGTTFTMKSKQLALQALATTLPLPGITCHCMQNALLQVAKTLPGTCLYHEKVASRCRTASSSKVCTDWLLDWPFTCPEHLPARFQFLADKRSWFLKDPDADVGGWEDSKLAWKVEYTMGGYM